MKVKLNRLLSGMLCLMLLMTILAGTVSAREILDLNRKGSISMTLTAKGKHEEESHPVVGAEISIYRVAGMAFDDGDEILTAAPGFTQEMLEAFKTSEDYRKPENLQPVVEAAKAGTGIQKVTLTTNKSGYGRVRNMPVGLYLVMMTKQDDLHHAMTPYLVTLPYNNADGTKNYDINANPKMDIVWDTVDVKVTKVWKDDKESDRPKSLLVELLQNGSVFEEVELNKDNNWTHTFTDLVADYQWKVQEKTVPEGYKGKVSDPVTAQDGTIQFTITNTKNPPPPPLIQTGQLNWPVPVLAIGGGLLILLGWGMSYEKKKEQE